ncbi:PBP1A family penicillin-binding protein [Roseomonas terrae]|jgi:penicillin-binding protein 1A|uniref:Penicillin-binding protein 1A n=1 Tax=Neoroseomonas terrae TaxID=424799 RepID=A0ABS5EJ91_9PROT|nr:PBP1A family penicillin-binding protein [Neoroseomonas terrae]MBR0651096.1 PBP1A family penicillin-binding protein [Neoroseomonas terrae]
MTSPDLRADAPLAPRRNGRHQAAAADPAPPPGETPRREKPARAKRRRRGLGLFRLLFMILVVGGVVGSVAAYGVYHQVSEDLPDYRWLADYDPPQMSRIYAADSRLTAELATERRVFVPIEAIPARVQQAFVSAEDQRFWDHAGVDPLGIGRALLTAAENYGSGRRMGGASTITQQVAKNMLVGNERSIMRKVREAILAVRIERALSKDRILELYLNEIFLGQSAYGVAAAAQAYFDKGLDELTVAEAAFLAALPRAPNNYNPIRFPERARARRDWVLDRMAEDGYITPEEARYGKAESISPRPTRRPEVVPVGQHFTEEVRRELIQRYGAEQTTMGGLVVRTSLEPQLQAAAEKALRDGLMAYDRRRGGWRGAFGQIAARPTEWMPALEAFQRPPGGLPEWRLAVVLEVRGTDARVGWIDRGEGGRGAPQAQTGLMYLQDLSWARPARDGRVGGQPSRMNQVVSVGDVVFVEQMPTQMPAQGRAARPERVELRQMPQVEGAVVALDPQSGRVLAMAGGWSFERSWFNRATQAQRQPGSSFKPFVYINALEQGVPPNTELLDEPIEVMSGGRLWRPQNYTAGQANGWVTMRQALERSLNLVTVRVAQQVGMDAVADAASRFGVIDNMPRYLALSLGAGETTVMRMAAGYAAFANGGHRVTPTLIDSVQDRRGRVIWRADRRGCATCNAASPDAGPPELVDPQRQQATDPIAAYQMVSLLQGVVQRGTGTRAGTGLNRPIAGKTGTTDDYKDNWFVGFTPDIVIAVWMGYDDPRSLGNGETGGGNAAPIFHDVLAAALRDSPAVPFRAPPGVALVRINVGNGSILEAFRPGTENAARRWGGGEGGAAPGGGTASGLDSNLGGLY